MDGQEMDSEMGNGANGGTDGPQDMEGLKMSPLGNYLLHRACDVVVMSSVVSLTWMDSNASFKSSFTNLVLVQKLITESLIKSTVEANFLLHHVLQALSYFGEHEQNQSRLLQLAVVLYEGVVHELGLEGAKRAFSEASGSDEQSWDLFEEKWIKPGREGKAHVPEKKKKEALKALLSRVIGKNIGQLHAQNKAEIKNLQPILFNRRKHERKVAFSSSETTEDIGLCRLFET
jgi:hypothetical protein